MAVLSWIHPFSLSPPPTILASLDLSGWNDILGSLLDANSSKPWNKSPPCEPRHQSHTTRGQQRLVLTRVQRHRLVEIPYNPPNLTFWPLQTLRWRFLFDACNCRQRAARLVLDRKTRLHQSRPREYPIEGILHVGPAVVYVQIRHRFLVGPAISRDWCNRHQSQRSCALW